MSCRSFTSDGMYKDAHAHDQLHNGNWMMTVLLTHIWNEHELYSVFVLLKHV